MSINTVWRKLIRTNRMNLKVALFGIAFSFAMISLAQKRDQSKLVFSGVSIHSGVLSHQGSVGTIQNFKALAPESDILKEDFSSYDKDALFEEDESGSMVGIHVHFKLVKEQKEDQKVFSSLRVGISFSDARKLSMGYSKSEKFRIDTLYSSTTNRVYYVDSTASSGAYMDYGQSEVFLNAAYLMSTNPSKRWSFFGGGGIMLGFSIDSYTFISKYNSSYNSNSNASVDDPWRNYESRTKDEYYQNDPSLSFIASLPLGVDFRIGNSKPFWTNSHLVFDYQPSIYFYNIPETSTTNLTTASIWTLGYKYEFR